MTPSHNTTSRFHFSNWLFPVAPLLIAVGCVWFCWEQRQEIFSRLDSPVLDNENWLPYAWALVAVLLLGFQVRRRNENRILWSIRILAFVCVSMLFVLMLAGRSGWSQYQVCKAECFGQHFGISARDRSATEAKLVSLLADESIATYLHRDQETLEHLVKQRSDLFARRPSHAILAFAALNDAGVTAKELLPDRQGSTFLLYALAGEVYGSPWKTLTWLEPPTPKADSEPKDTFVVFDSESAAALLNVKVASIDSISDYEMEALVFCVASYPDLIDAQQRQTVADAWLQRVPELGRLLAEGYGLGETLIEPLRANPGLRMRLNVEEGDSLPYPAEQRQIKLSLARSLRSLLQLTSGETIEWGEADESEFELTLKVAGGELYQYQRQVRQWRETYKQGRIRRIGSDRYYRAGRTVTEHVPTGKTKTETKYGATVELAAQLPSGLIKIDQTLAYWSDFLLRSDADESLKDADPTGLHGRLWPLGIHESYLRGAGVLAEGSL